MQTSRGNITEGQVELYLKKLRHLEAEGRAPTNEHEELELRRRELGPECIEVRRRRASVIAPAALQS